MKKYYIVKNNTQQGPYTIEELKDINISKSTLTWTEGMDEWTNAENIEDLKIVLLKKPPPIFSKSSSNKLLNIAFWVRFISILGYVFSGIVFFAAFFSLGYEGKNAIGVLIGLLIVSVIVFFPSLYLYKYSKLVKTFIKSKNNQYLVSAFNVQKKYWSFIGMTSIILLILFIPFIIGRIFI